MRKLVGRIAVLLILGAIVNVAVAWVIASLVFDFRIVAEARAVTVREDGVEIVHEGWWIERWEGFGSTSFVSEWSRDSELNAWSDGMTHASELAPKWSVMRQPPADFVAGEVDEKVRGMDMRGWPWRSLACYVELIDVNADPPFEYFFAIDAGYFRRPRVLEPRLLPLRPLLPGFIINTLFYAAILWSLFAAPFAVRRAQRRRRGLCETCAYPIGVSPVCTECGAAVPAISSPQESAS